MKTASDIYWLPVHFLWTSVPVQLAFGQFWPICLSRTATEVKCELSTDRVTLRQNGGPSFLDGASALPRFDNSTTSPGFLCLNSQRGTAELTIAPKNQGRIVRLFLVQNLKDCSPKPSVLGTLVRQKIKENIFLKSVYRVYH